MAEVRFRGGNISIPDSAVEYAKMLITGRDMPDSYYKSVVRNDKKPFRWRKVWMCPHCGEIIEPIQIGCTNAKLRKLFRDAKPLR